MFDDFVRLTREYFGTSGPIQLHEPRFTGREKEYLVECIDSTFVSSVGPFVDRFGKELAARVGVRRAVPTVNGTAALHTALLLAGVKPGHEVITQPLSFVATANAISHCGAVPCFVDVDRVTLGLDPEALEAFLATQTEPAPEGGRRNRATGRLIRACVPMHTFGHPCRIDRIADVCATFDLVLVEDAAEAIGSYFRGRHCGTFGRVGAFSFNGNKVITCGGGGAVVTDDIALADAGVHLTTTAKVPHRWEMAHDQVAFNYRMPNLNAALACAQLEQLDRFLESKRELAGVYREFFRNREEVFVDEPADSRSNFWLNAVCCADRERRDAFLAATHEARIFTRPAWRLLHELPMYQDAPRGALDNAVWLADRVVNLPSSVRVA